jgi:hypothetical protein
MDRENIEKKEKEHERAKEEGEEEKTRRKRKVKQDEGKEERQPIKGIDISKLFGILFDPANCSRGGQSPYL